MPLTFDEACEHPELRQEFVDHIDLEWAQPYIKSVRVVSDLPLTEDGKKPMMHARAALRARLFKRRGTKTTINIHQASFSRNIHQTVDDFLSSLIDHEGTHAKDIYFHPELLHAGTPSKRHTEDYLLENALLLMNRGSAKDIFLLQRDRAKHLMEIRACSRQLKSGRSLSAQYKENSEQLLAYAERQHETLTECIQRSRRESHDRIFNTVERYMSLSIENRF